MESGSGVYVHERQVGGLNDPRGLTVIPSRVIDGDERLAVADAGANTVQVFVIDVRDASGGARAKRAMFQQRVDLKAPPVTLTPLATPVAVAADRERRIYVAEQGKHGVSRWDPDATLSAWTHQADFGKGSAGAGDGEYDTPIALALDPKEGYLYVAETGNHRVQRVDAATGAHRSHLTPVTPTGLAVDPVGDVFIAEADTVTRRHVYDNAGALLPAATVPATIGTWTKASAAGHMARPLYVHFDQDGRLLVADTGNSRILVFARDNTGRTSRRRQLPGRDRHPRRRRHRRRGQHLRRRQGSSADLRQDVRGQGRRRGGGGRRRLQVPARVVRRAARPSRWPTSRT